MIKIIIPNKYFQSLDTQLCGSGDWKENKKLERKCNEIDRR
jgi:hypothetical protein